MKKVYLAYHNLGGNDVVTGVFFGRLPLLMEAITYDP